MAAVALGHCRLAGRGGHTGTWGCGRRPASGQHRYDVTGGTPADGVAPGGGGGGRTGGRPAGALSGQDGWRKVAAEGPTAGVRSVRTRRGSGDFCRPGHCAGQAMLCNEET